jgi:hypothetical protein
VNATLAHIQAHIDNGKMKDPALAMALKQTPLQQAMPPMPTQGVEPMPQVNEPTDVNLPQPAEPPPIM